MIDPYYEQDGITIYHGDCREVLPTLGRFDLLHTDPPYGIGANRQGLGTGKRNFHRGGAWDESAPLDLIVDAVAMADRAIVWGGNYFTGVLQPSNDWLIWHKVNDGLSFSECEMAWSNLGCNIRHLSHHWAGEEKQHPTAKPMPVVKWAISKATDVSTILDPFMGSGTTLRAAKDMGMQAIGIEIEERYCEIAVNRLAQGVLF